MEFTSTYYIMNAIVFGIVFTVQAFTYWNVGKPNKNIWMTIMLGGVAASVLILFLPLIYDKVDILLHG